MSGKFQRFNGIDASIEMLKNSWISKKFQLKCKIKKEVHEAQTASKSKKIIPQVFSENFAKFLRTPIFIEHFRWLLLSVLVHNIEVVFLNHEFLLRTMVKKSGDTLQYIINKRK